jgi:hypothetical protein
MAIFPVLQDQVYLLTAAPVATDNPVGAVLRDAANVGVRAAAAGGTQFANGLLFTDLGQLFYNDATLGLPANTQYVNGIPWAPDGSMCIAMALPVNYSNGLPFASNGAIAAVIA